MFPKWMKMNFELVCILLFVSMPSIFSQPLIFEKEGFPRETTGEESNDEWKELPRYYDEKTSLGLSQLLERSVGAWTPPDASISVDGIMDTENKRTPLSSKQRIKPIPPLTKRLRKYYCDTTRITLQTILQYLKSGRICGFRVSHVRFALGRKR